jgi:DNA-binding NarL/FixJ family response regulator
MIRILIVDDHPALQAGLTAVLRSEPGLVPIATAQGESDLWPALRRSAPDVVLLDYHLPPSDGLVLCREIKKMIPAPAVLLFSAYADAKLVVPALLAGADGVVNKAAPAPELYDAVRTVAGGKKVMPPIERQLLDEASARLDPEDLPILSMTLDETSPADIAKTLRMDVETVNRRLDRMIGRLRVEVPLGSAG